jgi:xanthine/CO dehydrogenase XdhC/CoxF family maturation factor
MLMTGDGDFQGMLSGGCLEGDLAERARQVAASGECQTVTYDLRQDDEELWGLGVGCEGLMRIFLQPLSAAADFQPFSAMVEILMGEGPGVAATVLESDDPEMPPGSALVGRATGFAMFGAPVAAATAIEAAAADALRIGKSGVREIRLDSRTLKVLLAVLRPPPRVLVLGAGLDAEPVVRLCCELGWRVTVQDHRPAYIAKGEFRGAEAVHCHPAESLGEALDLDRYDAAIVMSHHLITDQCYLRQLAATEMVYVGLLGPRDRRKRLMEQLGKDAAALKSRLHGPAGLDIGGRGPTSIALSIVSQLHRVLMAGVADA